MPARRLDPVDFAAQIHGRHAQLDSVLAEETDSALSVLPRERSVAPDRHTYPSFRGTSGRSDTGWVSSPSKPGSETLGNGTYLDCRPGWEAKARPRVRSSTHSSQRLVSATCQPLQWSRSSAENSSPRARPPDYDESSARRDHQASAAVIALSASWMPSPTSPAVAAQCKGTRARAPGSQRCSSRVSGSGAVPS